MIAFFTTALHDGSLWLVFVCLVLFAGVVIGFYTRAGSGVDSHPYAKGGDGSELGTDMPPETGREELEPILWPRRAGRRKRRARRVRRAS